MIEGITPINVFSLRIADISMILARYCIYAYRLYANFACRNNIKRFQ